MKFKLLVLLCITALFARAQKNNRSTFVKENYSKIDTTITMRDGIKLYTIIYIPRDQSQKYPFLIERTPYSVSPYGKNNYAVRIGPNEALMREKYIFVYQDVRGRYMSEGRNKEVTPYIPNKKSDKDVDESSDTYDTMDWLLKNIKNNNGRAGLYGISYPGFYATASLPGAHPSIKAVSPQAPVTDEFIGDDANHNGAFFLMDNFDFMNYFGKERNGPVEDYGSSMFDASRKDAYKFFLHLGPIKNTQSEKYFNHRSYIWNEYLAHNTYDDYWQKRNIRQYLKNIKIPTLVVGGWFDAEDLFGSLHTYEAIEKQSPENNNYLMMGPWTHGAWARNEWSKFGSYDFGSNTSQYFQDSLQTKFFNYFLKDEGSWDASEATVFETGTNRWRHFKQWPPENISQVSYYLSQNKKLSAQKNNNKNSFDEYINDPANPVPYTAKIQARRNNEYMVEDQRFTASRNDVLVYESPALPADVTIAGDILADLFTSISTTDADFIVKLIDVVPPEEIYEKEGVDYSLSSYFQRLVRAEVMRGKFRNDYVHPQPFIPGEITEVKIHLNDICHTFKKGHKIMVQVQSSWFPLVDMNPQKFMRIPAANENDFQKSTIRIYHDADHPSRIVLPVLQ
ncbi:CocE/NonD family hydrolase [Hanamia caeni]|uniref:CocE/NonD family hydrolase n=1 Tax=Hanamia caeni TaxID=2294116 RepID=A0A3M9N850_9BACT|nr:CocE/NonD family hydrolase [Hanamia caeni]RNI33393.1 CocE/NonD family hydrolase [Hanamia caeni]